MDSEITKCITTNRSKIEGLFIAFAYGFCSVFMTFINKMMLHTFGFDYPFFIMLCQMLFTVLLLELLKALRVVQINSYTLSDGKNFFLPSFFYGMHSVLALSALTNMNIPMYSLMKRCTPFVTLFLGVVVLKKNLPSYRMVISVAMITGGCFIAGYGDLAFDLSAYGFGAVSVMAQALYLILVQKMGHEYSATQTVYLNSYNNIPVMLLCCVVFNQLDVATRQFNYHSPAFLLLFLIVISLGCVLNYLLFLCTTKNSALTTSIVAAFKSNLSTLIGMFTFGGISINLFTLSGIVTNMVGGSLYTLIKYQENNKKSTTDKTKINQQINEPISNGSVHVTMETNEADNLKQ